MPRKTEKNDQRANEAIRVLLEVLQSVKTSETQSDALEAVKAAFDRIPDVMSHPIVKQLFAIGFLSGQRDAQDKMTKDELVLLRKWSKVTQAQLAEHVGLSQRFVSDMELGKAPIPSKYVKAIREFLNREEKKAG